MTTKVFLKSINFGTERKCSLCKFYDPCRQVGVDEWVGICLKNDIRCAGYNSCNDFYDVRNGDETEAETMNSDFQIIKIVKENKHGKSEVEKTFELTPVERENGCFCSECAFREDEVSLCNAAGKSQCGYKTIDGKVMVWQKVKK